MTVTEFSQEMDVIYENINKGGAIGLDEYEKSVILTRAQEKVVEALIANGDLTALGPVISVENVVPGTLSSKVRADALIYPIDDDIVGVLNLAIKGDGGPEFMSTTISLAQLKALNTKPYRYPNPRQAWDYITNPGGTRQLELILPPDYNATSTIVTMTSVNRPSPIIIEVLVGESIRGETAITEATLTEPYHPMILDAAVQLAEQYYMDKYPQPEN